MATTALNYITRHLSSFAACVQDNAQLIKDGQVNVPITGRYTVNSILRDAWVTKSKKVNNEQTTGAIVRVIECTTDQAIRDYCEQW